MDKTLAVFLPFRGIHNGQTLNIVNHYLFPRVEFHLFDIWQIAWMEFEGV